MGISKKKDWLKWIRKNFAGILDSKTGSMETLIDSGSTRSVNYVNTGSSAIADDETEELFGTAVSAAVAEATTTTPPHRRPMLPPPVAASPDSPAAPLYANDVYDCCVLLDGIPIKREFQYTLSDTGGYGKITKNDVEGLASKILESIMHGTTANFTHRGQRTVKVTLNVRQSAAAALDDGDGSPLYRNQLQQQQQQQHQVGRGRRSRSSADYKMQRGYYANVGGTVADEADDGTVPSIYGVLRGSSSPPPQPPPQQHRRGIKAGGQRYRRDQLIEMVQKSLAENLSFQNQRKPNRPEDYHRTRTKRRQLCAFHAAGATPSQHLQSTPLPAPPPPSAVKPKGPPKVAWSPYDFEPPAGSPSNYHPEKLKYYALRNQHRQQQQQKQQQQQVLYSNLNDETAQVDGQQVKQSPGGRRQQQQQQQQQQHVFHHRPAGGGAVGNNQKPKDRVALQEQTKNVDCQNNKCPKLAKKTYHVHEHHHYHHYNYMV